MAYKRTAKTIIAILYFMFISVKIPVGRAILGRRTGRLVILYYHGVDAAERENFAMQLDLLKHIAKVVPANWSGETAEGGLHVAITFDDAFANLMQNALPELASRGMNATVFIPTGYLGAHPAWNMMADDRFHADRVMALEELLHSRRLGVTFGSHTVTHPRLTSLDDRSLKRELADSREFLLKELGVAQTEIAFPYGDFDARVIEACIQVGYDAAYSIIPEIIDPSNDEFLRGRIKVSPTDGSLTFFLKATGAYSWMRTVARIKQFVHSRRNAKSREL